MTTKKFIHLKVFYGWINFQNYNECQVSKKKFNNSFSIEFYTNTSWHDNNVAETVFRIFIRWGVLAI